MADPLTGEEKSPQIVVERTFLHSKRLHRLVHPSTGRIFHVVQSPHEVDIKRNALRDADPNAAECNIVIHGSDEHIGLVREIHQHHEGRRDALLQRNAEILTHYEQIRADLDALSSELRSLTDDAVVALDASFDKFGYSARIRTKGNNDEVTINGDDAASQISKHEDRSMVAIKFWKRPTVRQYFHKELLWRSPNAGEVASFELFIDLVYVAVIDTIGEAAIHHASAESFLQYIIVFSISWKVWSDMTVIINWFEVEDIVSRLSVIFILITLYAFTTSVVAFFESTYTTGLAFYLASRFFMMVSFVWAAILTPMIRPTLMQQASTALIGAVLWIASIHVDLPGRYGLIFVAIFIDLFGSSFMMPMIRILRKRRPNMSSRLASLVDYLPAINIEHRVERTGAFISLVFGYSVITSLFQSNATFPLNAFLGKGILALIQAFVFNWIYFEIDACGIHVHAIRRHWASSMVWNTAHLPFAASFILAASTLSELVVAHDSSNANVEDLGEDFVSRSHAEVEPALRWFYCGGLGVALLSMTVISLTHIHKRLPNPRLRKRPRLLIRTAVAIIIICLPLTSPEDLSSLSLIAITTSLTAFVLILDLFGNSCSGDKFWTSGFCKDCQRKTTYEANCWVGRRRRREMERRAKMGEKMRLEEIIKRDNDSFSSLESGETRVDGADHGAGGY